MASSGAAGIFLILGTVNAPGSSWGATYVQPYTKGVNFPTPPRRTIATCADANPWIHKLTTLLTGGYPDGRSCPVSLLSHLCLSK